MPVLSIDSQTTVTNIASVMSQTLGVANTANQTLNVANVASQALNVTFSGAQLNILTVSGPQGPSGIAGRNGVDGTGALTGVFPIYYDQGSGLVGILSGYYATVSQLIGTSGALVAQIGASNAGVSTLNGLSGAVSVVGTGSIIVSAQGQRLIVSGSGLAAYADITGLSGWAASVFATVGNLGATGAALQSQINTLTSNLTQTGVQIENQLAALSGALIASGGALSAVKISGSSIIPIADFSGIGGTIVLYSGGKVFISGAGSVAIDHGDGINLSGQLQTTGSYLYRTLTGASGYIITLINAASAGVSSLNGASGVMTLQGAGNVTVTTVGQTITISGNTGDYALFAQKADLALTGSTLQGRIDLISGNLTQTGVQLITIITSMSGILDGRLALTGSSLYVLVTGASGQYINDFATKTVLAQTGVQLGATIALTGSGLYAMMTGMSGQGAIDYALKTNVTQTGVQLGATVALTGSGLYGLTTGMSGAFITRENGISGVLDGRLALTGSGLCAIITGMSGQNVIDYATKLNLALTGQQLFNLITGGSGQAVTDYATKTALTQTGVQLTTYLASLSGALIATGAALSAVKVTGSTIIPVANFSGIGGTLVIWSGNLILVSGAAAGGGGVSQGQLDAFSGYSTGTFATITNLALTGANLQAQINALTGLGTSLAFDIGRNIVVPSGTGSFPVTFSRDLGATAFVIPVISNNSGDPVIACYPSGVTSAGFTLVMSATVPTSGYRFSYLATTGSGYVVLGQSTGSSAIGQTQLDALSGYMEGNLVHRLGAETITGTKTFNGNLVFLSGVKESVKTISSNYSILSTDNRLYCNNTSLVILTFIDTVVASGQVVKIKLLNTGNAIFTGVFGQKFDGSDSYVANGQYSSHELQSNGSNWCIW